MFNGMRSACVSIGHCENYEGSAGHDDPDPGESYLLTLPSVTKH